MAETFDVSKDGAGKNEGKQKALIPRQLKFYEDELVALQDPQGVIWVHLKRLINCLGLSESDQIDHIRGHEVMAEGVKSLLIQTSRGARNVLFLRLGLVAFYLATLQVQRVKAELREKILRDQREAADVLPSTFLTEFCIIGTGR